MKSIAQTNQEGETQKKYDKAYWLKYTQDKFEESKNWRGEHVELQWFVNYMYYMGFQNLKYDKVQNRFVRDSRNPLSFYVNYTYMILRAVRNAVMRSQPQWDVDALPYGNITPEEQSILGEYLAFEYERLNIKEKTNKLVLYGLLYGLGIFQYGYDESADYGEGNAWVEVLDPFDTYIDPYCTSGRDARYVIKVVSKPLEILEQNPVYDKEALKQVRTSEKMSESEYKDLILNNLHDTGFVKDNVIVHETWCMTKEGVRVITTCEGQILRNSLTEFEKLPFVFYRPDINLSTIYGEGWAKNIVTLNKAINQLELSRLEYNILFNKGKILAPKGAGVKTITDQNGQIVQYKQGFEPKVMDMKPLGSDVEKQLGSLGNYMQQIGAANEAFLGQTPSGIKSGIAIETLVSNNYVNLADLIGNLATTLADLGEEILQMGYQYQSFNKIFRTDDGQYAGIVGEGGESRIGVEGQPDIVAIPQNPEVIVRITSGIAHTKQGKMEIMQMLRGMGAVSNRTLLEAFDIDPEEEGQRIQDEMMAMQGIQGGAEGGVGGPQDPMAMPEETPPEVEALL